MADSIAHLFPRLWRSQRLFNLRDKVVVISAQKHIFQNSYLWNIGRHHRQPGGEIFADLERVCGACQLVYCEWIQSDIKAFAISRQLRVWFAPKQVNIGDAAESFDL